MSIVFSVRVDDEAAGWVAGFAAGLGVTRSEVLEAALWRQLERKGVAARTWRCPVHGLLTDGALGDLMGEPFCGVSCGPDGACGCEVEPADAMTHMTSGTGKAPGSK